MNFHDLKNKPREELVELASKTGVPVHHKHKSETIAENIINKVAQPLMQPEKQDTVVVEKVLVWQTEEDVRALVSKIIAGKPEFQMVFDSDNVTFRYRGKNDCVNLSSLPRVIKMKAESVAKGALMPRGYNAADFGGKVTSKANNAYTNTVLA